jgi:hypothetical protein
VEVRFRRRRRSVSLMERGRNWVRGRDGAGLVRGRKSLAGGDYHCSRTREARACFLVECLWKHMLSGRSWAVLGHSQRDWWRRVQGGGLVRPRFGFGTPDLQSRLGLWIRAGIGIRLGGCVDLNRGSPSSCLRRQCRMLGCLALLGQLAFAFL